MSACYCDHEPAQVYRAHRVIARKQHRCDECGGAINPGDRYERVSALWYGHWDEKKTCSGCLMVRDHLVSVRPCFCWSHGGLAEEVEAEITDGWEMRDGRYVDTWPPGGRFRALALIAQAKRERRPFKDAMTDGHFRQKSQNICSEPLHNLG